MGVANTDRNEIHKRNLVDAVKQGAEQVGQTNCGERLGGSGHNELTGSKLQHRI